ncbi:transposase [Candidatus Nomurabacteria bacterium]|nr:transposase [Candidatus Nomurabacteria bacterium]
MSIRKVAFVPGEYYHIYNRGNGKNQIFHDEEDYMFFITLFHLLNRSSNTRVSELIDFGFYAQINEPLVAIGAYVLMPNHFHILITQTEKGDISKFMQKISTAYVMYYNKKYKRTGSLFEGKFKSQHLDTDNYLKYIFSYIHLNPIKLIDKNWKENGLKDFKKSVVYLNNYKYSSYLDYIKKGTRSQEIILNTKAFPNYFLKPTDFQKEIFEWLKFKE